MTNPNVEDRKDSERSWSAYQAINDALYDGNYTNGDVLFVIAVMIGEMVRDEIYDLEEVLDDIRTTALSTIRATAHS